MVAEWKTLPLEDCMAAIIDYRGKTPSKTTFGVPLVTAKVIKGGRIETPDEFIAEADYTGWMRRGIPERGDVVLTTEAPLGEVAQLDGSRVALAQRVITLRGKPCLLDNNFLKFLLQSSDVQNQLHSRGSGSTVVGIKQSELRKVKLTLPPLPEQKAIARILGALDDKIELNRRMNATLEAMARALFQSWFVDFDPVRAKQEGRAPAGLDAATAALFPDQFQDSELGLIPKGWLVEEVGDLASIDKGLSYKGAGLAEEGGMPMVNLGCFSGRGIFNAAKIKRYIGEFKERHIVNAGDLVIANTDMTQNRVIIGSPALVPDYYGETRFLFTHHVFAVRFKPGNEIWRRYIYFNLLKPEFREVAEGFSTGTTVLALPRDGLHNYSVVLPPMPLIEAFEIHIKPLLATIQGNNHQSFTLASLRDALLPNLMNGEVILNVAEFHNQL
jgi:type I restriction enzyme S subunit